MEFGECVEVGKLKILIIEGQMIEVPLYAAEDTFHITIAFPMQRARIL